MESSLIERLEKRISDLEKRVLKLENREKTLVWKDENTKLYWEIKEDRDSLLTYFQAQKYIELLNLRKYGGFSDWKIPTKEELETIFDLEDQPFILKPLLPNIPIKFKPIFWSATEDKDRKSLKWVAYFNHGYGDFKYQSQKYYLMATRKYQ